jgi:hypothetical protein
MSITMKRPARTVHLCTDMSLQAEHDRAVEALRAAEQQDDRDARLAGKPAALGAAKAVQEIEQQMRGSTLAFAILALPRKRWVELQAEHPAREGNEVDAAFRVNLSTFVDAVMRESDITVTDHEGAPVDFDPAADWDALADEMSNGQWEAFATAALNLNRAPAAPDFSKAASRVIRSSASK